MKIAMLGIYGGINRDFNPGNVMISYYTMKEIKRRIVGVEMDIFSLDFSIRQCIERNACFVGTPFQMEMTFFSYDRIDEICDMFVDRYDAVILGGDIVIGMSDAFFLKRLHGKEKRPKIIMNVVSTLWRPQLISEMQKENIKRLSEICDYISVREKYVEVLFRECGVENEIYLVPDPVLLHKKNEWPVADNVLGLIEMCKMPEKKIVGISECFLKEKDVVEALIKSSIIRDYSVVFFSYSKRYEHSEQAKKYRNILGKHCKYIFEYLSPWETFSLIENFDLCIGNAYHCCMASLTSGRAFIGLDPSPFCDSRHTDMIYDKEKMSKHIIKTEVINNDNSGQSLQKRLEQYIQNELDSSFDLDMERSLIQEHFDRMCDILR